MAQKKAEQPAVTNEAPAAQAATPQEAAPQKVAPQEAAAHPHAVATKLTARVYPVSDMKNLKAFADLNLGNGFAVRGIRLMEGTNGLFLSMPARKRSDGEYEDIFFPVTKEQREQVMQTVLNEYDKCMLKQQNQQPQNSPDPVQAQSM